MHHLIAGDEVTDILTPYSAVDRNHPAGDCWLLANMVGGLDGSAAVGGRVGALSDATDHELFLALRSLSDVVLVGAETVHREGYGPVALTGEAQQERRHAGRAPVPPLAVVSRSLSLDWQAAAFTGARPDARSLVVTCAAAEPARVARAAEVADVLVAGDETVDLRLALAQLADRGAGVVLCEGGPTLLGELIALDLLDELCLTLSPVLGGDPLPVAVSPPDAPLTRLTLAHTLIGEGTLYLRYQRPAPT